MRSLGPILVLLNFVGLSILGVDQLNRYVQKEGLFPKTLVSSNIILPGTPAQFQKNIHVKKEITKKKGHYRIKYAYKDHHDIPRIWSVTYPAKQTEELIYKFGVPPSIFEPYERTVETYTKRRKQLSDGLFMEQNNEVMPDLNALATFYKGYTKPIAEFATETLGPQATNLEQLNFILRFCQDIPYGIPPGSFDGKEIGGIFPPPQTLLNMFGDCDSKAVLFASTMSHFGFQDMVYISVPGHLVVGIEGLPRPYDAFLRFKNKKYILAEPVGPERLAFGDGKQVYTRMEGIKEVNIGTEYPSVPYAFSEMEEDDPFYISVKNAIVKSLPIDPDNTDPVSIFGNRATNEVGQLTVWINSPDFGEISVSIDNEEVGKITRFFLDTPSCGQAGTLSILKPPGTYYFKAESDTGPWEGPVTINANSCLMLEIGQ